MVTAIRTILGLDIDSGELSGYFKWSSDYWVWHRNDVESSSINVLMKSGSLLRRPIDWWASAFLPLYLALVFIPLTCFALYFPKATIFDIFVMFFKEHNTPSISNHRSPDFFRYIMFDRHLAIHLYLIIWNREVLISRRQRSTPFREPNRGSKI